MFSVGLAWRTAPARDRIGNVPFLPDQAVET
jgi:hypothetical protein